MIHLSVSECLFYGGIAVMVVTAVAAVICAVTFKITGKKIKHVMEQEYGELKGNISGRHG